ncbi:hypothetical protein Hanom_Chr04g00314341 [Helianthus anomalus]
MFKLQNKYLIQVQTDLWQGCLVVALPSWIVKIILKIKRRREGTKLQHTIYRLCLHCATSITIAKYM